MKTPLINIAIFSTFVYATCGPIVFDYYPQRSDKQEKDANAIELSDKRLYIKGRVEQKHYPDNKVKCVINFTLENRSSDTLVFSQGNLQISSNRNLIDTQTFNQCIDKQLIGKIPPNMRSELDCSYWSNTFQGSVKEFVRRLKSERLKLIFEYNASNEKQIIDSIVLIPNIERFVK